MITLRELTKRYGETVAVDGLTLDVKGGLVTGFLGPNGAGKSTTMRMILGLDRPTGGEALIDGRPYASMRHPVREVGALLDAKALHPARSARGHLVAQARSNGIPLRRVDEVLETVGLAKVARRPAGAFSLGMYQRLGVAGALLGDPRVLVFDEPVNGLDPDGVRWVRELVRSLAAEGRTVFLSSHLMSEMQLTADRLVIIGRGKLLADTPMADLLAGSSLSSVRVRTPDAADLSTLTGHLLKGGDVSVESPAADELVVRGRSAEQVGDLAHRLGLRLHELRTVSASLEQVYMELTAQSVEYETGDPVFGGTGTGRTRGAGA
ncbi:ATP-binding cassette domain-containing protein [Streptomyces anulatus]|uniref:ABC transporter ATP-binding protein n=1 Tax=Streptomyces TaxID=1883 RepID=UPI000BEFCA56|nr:MULTISPECIES: ATP-binding cassette domain-containing protein [Streptomyces]MCX4483629.1 ATP-binding cassette domain-containing protein [Streptomyces anulatus]MCX4517300.1 ATP-binding cassette domain-containing protein [Streptomyces anulatus]WSI76588.1 ATP-binding cassette domain-containing protein [Streptomyces anulatus]WSU72627.1 ATP-binding cassette domain-containing protein [Streptomyces anulatus]WTD28985.1 ATP-binding cassette domain-containing protein [Streptomyces anulatus]